MRTVGTIISLTFIAIMVSGMFWLVGAVFVTFWPDSGFLPFASAMAVPAKFVVSNLDGWIDALSRALSAP